MTYIALTYLRLDCGEYKTCNCLPGSGRTRANESYPHQYEGSICKRDTSRYLRDRPGVILVAAFVAQQI